MRTKLKQARTAKGFTVADVAARLNKSRSFYYKIEAGLRNPTIDTAKRIADILGSTVDELFFSPRLDESSSDDETSAPRDTA